ncbi:MAG: hypothetical protein ACK55I_46200, partial [bacterium]
LKLQELVKNNQENLNNIKSVALDQAWKILQLAVAEIVQTIQINYPDLAGKDKKTIAMEFLSSFYDKVFVIVNIPFVPTFLQPIISRYIKTLLMLLVSSTIDATVTIFKNTGVFKLS